MMGMPRIRDQAWECYYELVLPVDKYDIRNEHYGAGFIIVPISFTRRTGSIDHPPCSRSPTDDCFRDSAHAFWDSKALGWPPIYVIAPDGTATQKTDYRDQPIEWATPTPPAGGS